MHHHCVHPVGLVEQDRPVPVAGLRANGGAGELVDQLEPRSAPHPAPCALDAVGDAIELAAGTVTIPGEISLIIEKKSTLEAGSHEDNPGKIIISGHNDVIIDNKIDLNASYRFNIVNRDSGRYTHHTKTSLEIELTDRLDLDFYFVWDRIQEPKTKSDGSIPDRDDFYFIFCIGFEL